MLKKPFLVIKNPDNDNEMKIYGNNHDIEIQYKVPEWEMEKPEEEQEMKSCFTYKGNTYFLSEILRVDKDSQEGKAGFYGYHGWTYFSGILIKLSDSGDSVKVYTYSC